MAATAGAGPALARAATAISIAARAPPAPGGRATRTPRRVSTAPSSVAAFFRRRVTARSSTTAGCGEAGSMRFPASGKKAYAKRRASNPSGVSARSVSVSPSCPTSAADQPGAGPGTVASAARIASTAGPSAAAPRGPAARGSPRRSRECSRPRRRASARSQRDEPCRPRRADGDRASAEARRPRSRSSRAGRPRGGAARPGEVRDAHAGRLVPAHGRRDSRVAGVLPVDVPALARGGEARSSRRRPARARPSRRRGGPGRAVGPSRSRRTRAPLQGGTSSPPGWPGDGFGYAPSSALAPWAR